MQTCQLVSRMATHWDPALTTCLLFVAAAVIKVFLDGMAYSQPNLPNTNNKIEEIMRAEMNARNIGCPQLEKILHLSASLSEVCCDRLPRNFDHLTHMLQMGYRNCTVEEKLTIALFNW